MRQEASYRAGKATGFGFSLTVFVTVFYFMLSFLGKMPPGIEYGFVISAALLVYIAGMVVWRRRLWD